MELVKGSMIENRYFLKDFVGKGSYGEVWYAFDQLAMIEVAIKIYAVLDEKGLDDFRQEFAITHGLSHPNILRMDHLGVFEGRPYLVTAFCKDGSSLKYVGNADETTVWRFIRDVADGLHYMHTQKNPIIHQDIKPDNIMIGDDGRFLITDFGISKSLLHTMLKSNGEKEYSGTVAYMAPERCGKTSFGAAESDVWALGMSAYELIAGDVLLNGMGGFAVNQGMHIEKLNLHVSGRLNDMIQLCLSEQMYERPKTDKIKEYADAILSGKQLPMFTEWLHPHSYNGNGYGTNSYPSRPYTPYPNPPKRNSGPSNWLYYIIGIAVAVVVIGAICFFSSQIEKGNEAIKNLDNNTVQINSSPAKEEDAENATMPITESYNNAEIRPAKVHKPRKKKHNVKNVSSAEQEYDQQLKIHQAREQSIRNELYRCQTKTEYHNFYMKYRQQTWAKKYVQIARNRIDEIDRSMTGE